jgi:hypothetical protein
MGPPKGIDYAVICPESPFEWLGALTARFITSLRSMYMNSSLGDHEPFDLTRMENHYCLDSTKIDYENAMLFVDKSSDANDLFRPYRVASANLKCLIAEGTPKQAFSRTAIANVLYIVAPFDKEETVLLAWLLGAVSKGLFGSKTSNDSVTDWKDSVVFEVIYVEDLVSSVNTEPYGHRERAFALYDKIFEKVPLQCIIDNSKAQTSQINQHRFVNEKLYHLASDASNQKLSVLLGYTICNGWLCWSLVDSVGSITDADVIFLGNNTEELEASHVAILLDKALSFAVLCSDNNMNGTGMIAITKLGQISATEKEVLESTWNDQITSANAKYVPFVSACLFVSAALPEYLQLLQDGCDGPIRKQRTPSSIEIVGSCGLLMSSPQDICPGKLWSNITCISVDLITFCFY